MDKDAFLGELIGKWRERDCTDIDGGDMQDLLEKHGLIEITPATEEDCKEEWAQEYGIEPGDPVNRFHPDLMTLMALQY